MSPTSYQLLYPAAVPHNVASVCQLSSRYRAESSPLLSRINALTCSPKTDPGVMRAFGPAAALKKAVAEQALDNAMLKELNSGKW